MHLHLKVDPQIASRSLSLAHRNSRHFPSVFNMMNFRPSRFEILDFQHSFFWADSPFSSHGTCTFRGCRQMEASHILGNKILEKIENRDWCNHKWSYRLVNSLSGQKISDNVALWDLIFKLEELVIPCAHIDLLIFLQYVRSHFRKDDLVRVFLGKWTQQYKSGLKNLGFGHCHYRVGAIQWLSIN